MNGEERSTLVIILAIVASLGLGNFGLRPALAHYHNQSVAVGARSLETSNLYERKTTLVQIEGQLKKYAEQIQLLEIAIPAEPQYPELLAQLAALVETSSLTLTSVQPQQSDITTTLAVPVNLTVRGSFPNMLGLAGRIETNLRPITVSSISVIESGDTGDTTQLTATIQMRFARIVAAATIGGTP